MRHRKSASKVGRSISHRKALMKNMAASLLINQRIETTMAKAKSLRGFAESLITLAKNGGDAVSARRQAFKKLCNRDAVRALFSDVAPLFKTVPGGYTHIMRLRNRKGDGTAMALIEFTKRTVSDDDLMGISPKKEPVKKKTKAVSSGPQKETEKPLKKPDSRHSVAPEIDIKEKEEHSVEDVKKEKARTEQKKISKGGFFKRFRRKSMG